ncbi:beta strand repeat-containing protein [Shimia biformata]|uniref:beta strand repeat-containing protein n=1 Tax=Shimia biformata TaxID=1294299 RepID=UPI001950B4C8|nr:Ig-like domain-containing protein [Shimia biformata]
MVATLGPTVAWADVPDFSAVFTPDEIVVDGTSQLTFTIDNNTPDPIATFLNSSTLPAGMVVAVGGATSTCGAAITAPVGGSSIAFSGERIGAFTTCDINVPVTAQSVGTFNFVSGSLVTSNGNAVAATADLDATVLLLDSLTLSASQTTLDPGGYFTLSYDYSINFGVGFSNAVLQTTLPAGLEFADPANITSTCAATNSVTGDTFEHSYFLPVNTLTSCLVSVDVRAVSPGTYDLVQTLEYTSVNPLPQDSISITVNPLPSADGVNLIKSFDRSTAYGGDTTTLTFTLLNQSRTEAATDIAFSDDLDAFLSGTVSLGVTRDTCGGTVSGSSTVSVSDVSLAPESSCEIDVNVQLPASPVSDTYTNTTSTVTGLLDGNPFAGTAASADLIVAAADSAPVSLTKSYTDDPIIPGGTVTVEYTVTNNDGTNAATAITFDDPIGTPSGMFLTGGPYSDICGTGSFAYQIDVAATPHVRLEAGSLPAGGSCTFQITLSTEVATAPGSYPVETSSIFGTINGISKEGAPASDTLEVLGGASLSFSKAFSADTVVAGQSVDLTFSITSAPESAQVATALAFTDDLDAFVSGATATAVTANTCGGTMAGTSVLSYSGGTLAPDGTCEVTVTVDIPGGATGGNYTNTASALSGLTGTDPVAAPAPSDDLTVYEVEPLAVSSVVSPATALPGETVELTYTFENPDPTATKTVNFFSVDVAAAIPGATVTFADTAGCGPGAIALPATSTNIFFFGMEVTEGTPCEASVTVVVPASAANGTYVFTTSAIDTTGIDFPPENTQLEINQDILFLTLDFVDANIAAGGSGTATYTLENLSGSVALTSVAFGHDLDAQLSGMLVDSVVSNTCGGVVAGESTSILGLLGGTLAASASCVVTVELSVPGATPAGPVVFTPGAPSASAGVAVIGSSLGDTLQVLSATPPTFTKTFVGGAYAPGGVAQVTYEIVNNDSSAALNSLTFADDLDATLAGLVVTGGTGSGLCGAGSIVAGTSVVSLSAGSLPAGGSCQFTLDLQLPAGAAAGGYTSAGADLFDNGLLVTTGVAGSFSVEPAPSFTKAFVPASVVLGDVSTLTFYIDNSGSSLEASSLDFTDNLPAGLVVAPVANAVSTCIGGTLTAVPGSAVVSYSGGSIVAGEGCTLSVSTRALSAGALINTSGDLTSNLGNSGTANATLTVTAAPVPGFDKSFATSSVALNGTTTMTWTIDNSAALIEATSLDVTDILPAGMIVATPANASTTCTGGTLTAADGSGTVSYSGGSVVVGASCSVSVDVQATGTGALVNTTGALTSSLGNSGTGQATLSVPVIGIDTPITADNILNASEAPTTTISGTTSQIEDGQTVTVNVSVTGGGSTQTTTTVSGDAWSVVMDLSGLGEGGFTVTADASDINGSAAEQASATGSIDQIAPDGWGIALTHSQVNLANLTAQGFQFAGAEVGATYAYTITSSGGGTPVTDTGTVTSANQTVPGIDVTGLADGTLTFSVTLTDVAGNESAPEEDTVGKDADAPGLSFDSPLLTDDVVNAAEASTALVSGTASGLEDGQVVSVEVTDTGSGLVSGTASVSGGVWSLTLDLSGLADGTLDLTADASDLAGNPAAQATATLAKDVQGPTATLSGPAGPQSDPFTVTLTFSEAVTGFELADLSIQDGVASDLTGGGTSFSFLVTPDHDGTVQIGLPEGAAEDAEANLTQEGPAILVEVHLSGTPNPDLVDSDGDGISDIKEGSGDRDGDGIPNAQDYDPQGYFYCEDDGRILSGGGITVTGPSGSNSSVGIANDIQIVRDGSSGEFQWFALRPGTYTVSYSYPTDLGVASTARLSSGAVDVTSLLPDDPAVLGSTESGTTGFLADPSLAANPVFYESFTFEAGDPYVLANNVPLTQCAENQVSVVASDDGAEANGGTPDDMSFTVSQGRVANIDTVIDYVLTGTATSGADFTAVPGSITLPAGDTSAVLDIAVLEDVLVEGSETVILTLTGVSAGDDATVLSPTPAELTRTATIADDDLAMIAVTNDDLTASENGEDTAQMSFHLLGAPVVDVVLQFAGDGQCDVSPATLTFTTATYDTPQSVTITAVDDDEFEGSHSCQPTVTVSSTDAQFASLTLSLASVAVTDDLVDQIRDQLAEVLENDLEAAVRTQQRFFNRMAKGALRRLKDGVEHLGCGPVEEFDVDGSLSIEGSQGQSSGTFGSDFYNCLTGQRQILDGSFSLSRSDDMGTQLMLQFAAQNERFHTASDLRGWFWGGYGSRTNADGPADGSINGLGVNGGIYGAREMGQGLFLDYYAAGGVGHHRFDLTFAGAPDDIGASGHYNYGAVYAGASVSGQTQLNAMTLSPRVGVDVAFAAASDASVTVQQLANADTGSIDIRNYNGGRLFAEVEFAQDRSLTGVGAKTPSTRIRFAPRVACELSSYDGTTACGFGLAFANEISNPLTGLTYGFELDYEQLDDVDRFSLDLVRRREFANGRGSVVTRFSAPSTEELRLEHSIGLDF